MADRVPVDTSLVSYIAELAHKTRQHPMLRLGVSTRGGAGVLRAARARAAMFGQTYVTPDHIHELVAPVFSHRMLLTPEAELKRVSVEEVLAEVLAEVPVPGTRSAV